MSNDAGAALLQKREGDELLSGARRIGEAIKKPERHVRWRWERGAYKGVVFQLPGSTMLHAWKSDLLALYSPK